MRGYGVGRNAIYSSLETLEELGLVESNDVFVDGRQAKVTVLPDKGLDVAYSLQQLMGYLPLEKSVT